MAAMVQKYSGKTTSEKSNFAQTCNLLSLYLKERGNLGDIIHRNLQPTTGPDAARETLNLLPSMENSNENKSFDFLPQVVGFTDEDSRKSCSSDPATNQMTVFYAGKVMVFDDLPAEKAKEIMAFAAGKGSSTGARTAAFTSTAPVEQLTYLDLPLTRTASLYRFFEKRKDRIAAKAPYQVKNRLHKASAAELKPEERNPWQLELKL